MKKLYLILLLILPALACFSGNKIQAPNTSMKASMPTVIASAAIEPPSPTGIALTQSTPEPSCTITAESLNVRSQPEGQTESNVLTWIYSGDIVTILEDRGGWLKVRTDHFEGWISSNYCTRKN